jgi:drug/metabolite transporter, DME family
MPVAWGATLSLAEPLTASLLGVLVLGERLGPAQLAGCAFVAAGLAILAASTPRS